MKVIRLADISEEPGSSKFFTGRATLQPAIKESDGPYNVAYVNFEAGVRNKLHTHSSDQVLIVTEGRCIVATEHEQVEIAAGDVVLTPAGEKHWHGAAPGSTMTHISITAAGSKTEQVEP